MTDQLKTALETIPGAKVTWKPSVERGATAADAHFRVEFVGWKTAVLVVPRRNGSYYVGPARISGLKKVPLGVHTKRGAAPGDVVKALGAWSKKYLKAYPVIARGPSMKQVLDWVYYGAPLKDVYYK